jgi:hypothetical protein
LERAHVLPEEELPELLRILREPGPEGEGAAARAVATSIENCTRAGLNVRPSEKERVAMLGAIEKAWLGENEQGNLSPGLIAFRHFLAHGG